MANLSIKYKLIKEEKKLNYNVKMRGRTLDFLNRVESLNGYINYVDALELLHHYLNHFPAIFDLSLFSIEDELILCYFRLKKLRKYNEENYPKKYYMSTEEDVKEFKKERKKEYQRTYARRKKNRDRAKYLIENETLVEKELRLEKNRQYQRDRRAEKKESIFNIPKKSIDEEKIIKRKKKCSEYYHKHKVLKPRVLLTEEQKKENCRKLQSKWYIKNRERIIEKRRIIKENNPEQVKIKNKKLYLKYKDIMKLTSLKYYYKHRDKILKKRKKNYQENKKTQ